MTHDEYEFTPVAEGYYERLGLEPGTKLDLETRLDLESAVSSEYNTFAVPEEKKEEVSIQRERLTTAIRALKNHQNKYDRYLRGGKPAEAVEQLESNTDIHSPELSTEERREKTQSKRSGQTRENNQKRNGRENSSRTPRDTSTTSRGTSTRNSGQADPGARQDSTTAESTDHSQGARSEQTTETRSTEEGQNQSENSQFESGILSSIVTGVTGLLPSASLSTLVPFHRLKDPVSEPTSGQERDRGTIRRWRSRFPSVTAPEWVQAIRSPFQSFQISHVVWGVGYLIASLMSIIGIIGFLGGSIVIISLIMGDPDGRGLGIAPEAIPARIAFGLAMLAAILWVLWKFFTVGAELLREPGVRVWLIGFAAILALEHSVLLFVACIGVLGLQGIGYVEYVKEADWDWWKLKPLRDSSPTTPDTRYTVEGNVSSKLRDSLQEQHLPYQLLAFDLFYEFDEGLTQQDLQEELDVDESIARFVIQSLKSGALITKETVHTRNGEEVRYRITSFGRSVARDRSNTYRVVKQN